MQPEKLAVLGRQPELSLAELIARYGRAVQRLGPTVALVSTDIDLTRLGGVLKVAQVAGRIPAGDKLAETLAWHPAITQRLLSSGKTSLGLSWYGGNMTPTRLNRLGLELKSLLRQRSSVRIIPNRAVALTAAQINHNRLLDKGAEIILVPDGSEMVLAITQQIQDIDSYSRRDYGRPARAARVGMLPPKLAQIMINLTGLTGGGQILDPFCGSGVILQEALLAGFSSSGSDAARDMVAAAKANLAWLEEQYPKLPAWSVRQLDATTGHWEPPAAVVTEGYLGPPLSASPTSGRLERLRQSSSELTLSFLRNLHPQLNPGTPVVMTLPAWRQDSSYQRLEIVDQIIALGYSRRQFAPVKSDDLFYHRPAQTVAREIIVLRSK